MDEVKEAVRWKDASVEMTICYCNDVKKKDIILAIVGGARNIKDITEKTGASRCSASCGSESANGRCCEADIREMLDFYAPIVDQLRRRPV